MNVKRIRVYKSTGRSPDYISVGKSWPTYGPGQTPPKESRTDEDFRLEQERIARAIEQAKSGLVR
jgi:hypothetical protein